MQLQIDDRFPVSRETLVYKIFLDDLYNQELHRALDFKSRTVKSREDTPTRIMMELDFLPNRDLPKTLQRLFKGASMGYTEFFDFDKVNWRLESLIKPMAMRDRIEMRGEMCFHEDGPHASRRTYTLTVQANLPIGSGVFAKILAKNIHESYERASRFMLTFIRTHGLAAD